MPELPEVETVRRELAPHVEGRTIVKATFLWPGTAATHPPDVLAQLLAGRRVERLDRRGKYLIADLDRGGCLIIHLCMTGRLFVRSEEAPVGKHTRALLHLDNGHVLHFQDQRKFGRFYLVENADEVVGHLGPEPLDPEWRVEDLARALRSRRAPIKALLLDQRVVAGIGNIYADEALFLARVHPLRPGGDLSEEEVQRLHEAIRLVLAQAIALRGSSISTYLPPSGQQGEYQEARRVFRREDAPCPRCGTPIERIRVRGRSTFFCPACQETPPTRRA